MTKPDARSVKLPAGVRTAWDEVTRAGFIALGCFFLTLGIIGAFLPVMPTTVFLIGAAWAFGRSSPRLENWMLEHPRLGPSLIAWRAHGAIPRRAKFAACVGKAIGFIVFLLAARPAPWLAVLVFTVLATVAIWIVRRPEPAIPEHSVYGEPPFGIGITMGSASCD